MLQQQHPLWRHAVLQAQFVLLEAKKDDLDRRVAIRCRQALTSMWFGLDRERGASASHEQASEALERLAARLGVRGKGREAWAAVLLETVTTVGDEDSSRLLVAPELLGRAAERDDVR